MSRTSSDKTARPELRRLRYNAGFSQTAFAKKVGISRQAYLAIETTGAMPKPQTAKAIAEVLGVEPMDFLEELEA